MVCRMTGFTYSTEFCDRLRKAREARALDVPELAALSGVPAPTVYRLEAGRSKPSVDNLGKLAKALRCSTDDLLGISKRKAGGER